MIRALKILIVIGAFACVAQAQTAPADQTDSVQTLINQINELKARLAAVEAKQAQTPPPAEAAPAPVPSFNPDGASMGVFKGIKFQGFGEVGYKADTNAAGHSPQFGFSEGPNGNFATGDFDLFLTSHINDKTMVLSEIVFEAADAQSFNVNLARMLLKYDANDYLKMSFGRYHTATSYFNQVFHSGKWLQTPTDRPLVVQFASNGGLLPTQAIGASITGKIPSGKAGLNYIFEYGTSDTIRPDINSRELAFTDESNGNGTTVGLFAKPEWLPGLDIGGSFYHDRLNPTDTGLHIGQTILSAHAVYLTPKFEFLNEVFAIQHAVDGGRTFTTPAFYSIISDNVKGKWRPYFEFQYANANKTRVILDDVGLRYGPSAGVRYDFNGYVAFKTQYDRTYRRDLSTINGITSQLAFRF
jgi:hypothetical protein